MKILILIIGLGFSGLLWFILNLNIPIVSVLVGIIIYFFGMIFLVFPDAFLKIKDYQLIEGYGVLLMSEILWLTAILGRWIVK